ISEKLFVKRKNNFRNTVRSPLFFEVGIKQLSLTPPSRGATVEENKLARVVSKINSSRSIECLHIIAQLTKTMSYSSTNTNNIDNGICAFFLTISLNCSDNLSRDLHRIINVENIERKTFITNSRGNNTFVTTTANIAGNTISQSSVSKSFELHIWRGNVKFLLLFYNLPTIARHSKF